jgi:hypothetical protein
MYVLFSAVACLTSPFESMVPMISFSDLTKLLVYHVGIFIFITGHPCSVLFRGSSTQGFPGDNSGARLHATPGEH